jgi:universal stress protein A
MSVGNILFATDFSDLADEAARVACDYAERFQARIHLFHVFSPGEVEVTKLLSHTRETLMPGAPTIIVTTAGDPAEEIVRYATGHRIDLIVLGTHGRSGVSRVLLGSVAERVVRTAPCPVLVVPERDRTPTAAGGARAVAASSTPALEQPAEGRGRCLVCSQRSRDLVCGPCRAKIRGEALVHKRQDERAGRT